MVPDITKFNAHDSGYKTYNTMLSLCTIEDSNKDYFSNSSKEPNVDKDKDAPMG